MSFTFKGGIHIDEHKDTNKMPIEKMPSPSILSIPLLQHIGTPALPVVKKGDFVRVGQIIGKNDEALCCPVHSSVSGTVVDIQRRDSYSGKGKTDYVIIENDGRDEECEFIPLKSDYTLDEFIACVKNAGISGMGGASFPTYAKIQSAIGKAKELIINCAECEPYITANHRLLLEDAESIIAGVKILISALGIDKAVFAVEDNKPDAISLLRELVRNEKTLSVAVMKTKYPQGDERQIIYALHKVQLPTGRLPADIGYIIFNPETCASVYHAVNEGRPLIKRIVTVSGDCIKTPKNLLVHIGTSFTDVIEYCGGFIKEPEKIVSGGPMMGMAQWDINTPVVKGTAAILALSESKNNVNSSCIHCGKCLRVCPMNLMPCHLAMFSSNGKFDMCEEYNCMSCVECGCCTYTCPGNVPIVQHIRKAKAEISVRKRNQIRS